MLDASTAQVYVLMSSYNGFLCDYQSFLEGVWLSLTTCCRRRHDTAELERPPALSSDFSGSKG